MCKFFAFIWFFVLPASADVQIQCGLESHIKYKYYKNVKFLTVFFEDAIYYISEVCFIYPVFSGY